jgi:type IV pilus assembly protein PilC
MANKLATAYHNLSIMLEAGIPVQRALNTIAAGLKGELRKTFLNLVKGVSAGNCLAETMSKYPNVFATLDVMLVDAADTSGNLSESLKLLSEWYDFSNRLKNRLISGLMLPLVVIHIAALVGPLPYLFMGIINVAGYIIKVAITLALFYIPLSIILATLHLMPNTGTIRRFLDFVVLKIPILGLAVRQLALSRYCRAFNMLYKAGIPIIQCAQQAPGVTGNVIVADVVKGGAESAQAGNMVWEGFSPKLPADFLNIWRIGEETGELDNSIKRLADNTTENAEQLFSEFVQWLPRIIYWLICAVIVMQILMIASMLFGAR